MLKQPQKGCLGKHILTVHDLLLCRDENYKCSPEMLVKSLFAGSEQSPPDLVQGTSSNSAIGRSEVLATKLNEVHGVEGRERVPYELWHALAAAYISPTDGRSDKKDLEEFLLSCVQMPGASTIGQVAETCRLSVEKYKPNKAKNSSSDGTLSIKESCVFRVLDEANNELINLLVNVRYEVGRSKKSTTLQGPEDRIYRLEASDIEISLQNVGPISFLANAPKDSTLPKLFSKKTQTSECVRISCDDVGKFYVHVVPPKTNPSPGSAEIYKKSCDENVNLSKFSLQMMKHDHIGRRVLASAYNANSAITRIVSAWACVGLNSVNLKWHKNSCEKVKYKELTGYGIEGSWLFRVDGCLVYVDAEYEVFKKTTASTLLLLKAFRAIVGEEKYDEYFRERYDAGVRTRENIVYDASITKGNDPLHIVVPKLELYKSAEYQYTKNTQSSTSVVATDAPISEICGIINNAKQSILTGTGINKDTLQAVVCCATTWDTSYVGLLDHRVLHANSEPATATNNSALASSHVLEEHFIFYNRAGCLYVYVRATYKVGNYAGNSAAMLSALQVGVSEASDIVFSLDAENIQSASLTTYNLSGYKAVCDCNELREAVKSINVVGKTKNLLQAYGSRLTLYQDNDNDTANTAMAMALGNVVQKYVSQIDHKTDDVQAVFKKITEIVGNPFCQSSDVRALKDLLSDRVTFLQKPDNSNYGTCVFFDPVLVDSGGASKMSASSASDRVALLKGLRGLTEQPNMNAAMLEAIVNILTPVKPPRIVHDMGAALQTEFLQETYSVQITDYMWSISTNKPDRVSLTHDVLLAPRAWWKKTGSETGSVKVSIKFSMKMEYGDASRKGYIVFDDVSVTVYGICDLAYLGKTLTRSAGAAPIVSVYSSKIETLGCCVSMLDILESSYTLYNSSYRYMIQNSEMGSEPNALQNCLKKKVRGLVQEFVNLYGICDILEVPGMSLETRSDVLYHENPEENSTRDLVSLSKSHQMAISDTLLKSGIGKLSEYIGKSLQGTSVTNVALDSTYSSLSDAADALMNDGIHVVQKYEIIETTASNTRVSTFLNVTLCAKMSRKIGDRWVIAVTSIDLGVQSGVVPCSALGADEYAKEVGGTAKREGSVLRLSSACIALLVKCEDIDTAAARYAVASQAVAETHVVVGMDSDTVVERKKETVNTGDGGHRNGTTGQPSVEESCASASESHSASSDKGCAVPLGEQLVAADSCSKTLDEKRGAGEGCQNVPEVKGARLHAALYGALRGHACPDDKDIKKLLGVLVNVATDGKILCTDAYVGGRIPLRVSYKKLSDNKLLVTYCMMAESGKYGVIEMELQYTVAKEKNSSLAGGLVHKVKEGKFFIKGNNPDLVSESVHNIEKPVMISETKWHAFVDKHKKQLDSEHKKLGFWRRFVEFVGKVCSAITAFLCKICSYFSCIFCCFHRKTYRCEARDAQVTCDNGIQGSYTAIDAANDTVRLTENNRDSSEVEVQSSCAQPINGGSARDLSKDDSPATCVVDTVLESVAPTPTARVSLGRC